MKQAKLVLFIMIALCGSLTLHAQKTKKKSKASTTQTAAKIKYQCPMKCEGDKTYAEAGKCPVCNMNLKTVQPKEKKKDDHSGHSH